MFHLGLFEIFVSSSLKPGVINSDHITWLLTLQTLPSGRAAGAAKNDYVLLAVHDHRCVIIPRLAEKKYVFLSGVRIKLLPYTNFYLEVYAAK